MNTFDAVIERELTKLSAIWGNDQRMASLRVCVGKALAEHGELFVRQDLQRMVNGAKALARFEATRK